MANLGSLFYTMGIRDLTDADFQKINKKLEKAGSTIKITPEMVKPVKDLIPKGLKLELDPELKKLSNEALEKAAEGKTMKVAIAPLLTGFREAIIKATKDNPPSAEIGVQETKLRSIIQNVLNKQGFMLTVSTVNDNYSKAIQQKLNGRKYTVTIHADAKEIARSVQASLMQVQSRYFGLQVSKDILRNSIDNALMGKPFNIQIAVMPDQARRAVQNALNNARMVGKDDALAYQRLQTGELRAAQAELARLKAAQQGAASAAKTHTSASVNLGGALGSNIKIAGELGSVMASLYSIHAAKQFLSQVIEIGGELEHQKIALETIYGSESKMESLYGQIKGLARQSPFGVMELTKNIKQLSAYGVAYNEVYDTAKRLADISAATSVDIQRLILAFGKTKNRTFLDGLEAKQFAYANIPIYDMLSKKLTELEGKFVSVKDVMGRIKKREIGFDMVKDILWDMTDEGGKFYNMQEKLAGSVKTSWKLVRDNIELMFGEIAESSVGSGLKSVAELLQGITREWKTVASVVGAGAIAFGVYKTAVLAHNVVAGQAIVTGHKQQKLLKANHIAANQAAVTYRKLTAEEVLNAHASSGLAKIKGINILRSQQLNSAEAKALLTKKLLTKEDILRMVALKKISAGDAAVILMTKKMTAAEEAAMTAHIKRAAAAKRSTVIMAQLKASIVSTLGTLKSFALASLPMAAIGAVVALWQRNSEEMQKAKEIGDNIFTKAVDGAKGLKEIHDGIKSGEGMTELEVSQGIEKLENAIKDYSPTPIEDINKTLVDHNGHLLTAEERLIALRKRVEELAKAYKEIQSAPTGLSGMTEGALKHTDEGWFNDGLVENAKDYTNALKRRSNLIATYATRFRKEMEVCLNAAIKADKGFAEATEGMGSYEEKLGFLIDNINKYSKAVEAFDIKADQFDLKDVAGIGNLDQIKAAYDELLSDTDKFIADMNARMRSELKWNPANLTALQKTELSIVLKGMVDQMENAGEEAKQVLMDKFEQAYKIAINPDRIGPRMREVFTDAVKNSTDESVKEALRIIRFQGYNALSDAQKKIVEDLMTKAKNQAMADLKLTNQAMADYLAANPLTQHINIVVTETYGNVNELLNEIISKKGYPGFTETNQRYLEGWTKDGNIYNARNAALQALQDATNNLEAAKQAGVGLVKAQQEYDEVISAVNYAGWGDLINKTKDQKSNKTPKTSRGSQKDEFAESLKQRFKDIKDAWSEFQKWSKTEGRDAAATRIGESGLFSTLSADQIPKTIEDYRALVKGLENELRKAGVKGNARESLLNDLLKQLLDIDKTVVDEQLKLALDKVSKEAERQLADWNLFDKIRKATGNQDLAMSIAFGMNATAETDYPAMVKKQFADLAKELGHDLTFDNTSLEEAKKLGDEIEKSYKDTADKLEKYAREQKDAIADILNEYQSLSDKLAKIDADRERKIEVVDKSTMPETEKAKLKQRINVEADYQKFTQSNEYLRFFNDIYGLTLSEANKIGDLIQLNLNQELQAGLITIYDYEKEMEKVRKQLETLRNVKSDAMTFMTGGVKGLNDLRLKKEEGNLANNDDYKKALEKQVAAQTALNEAKEKGNEEAIRAAEEELNLANERVKSFTKIRDAIIKDQEQWQGVFDVTNIIANIAQGMSDAFNTLRDMADSFGFDTDSNAWNTAAAVMDTLTTVTGGVQKTLQSLMSGDLGGVISGVFDTLLTPFTIWNQLHDKKLDKMIEKSKEAAQIMQNQYDLLEKQMANFLGNAALMNTGTLGGGYGKQRELMQGQLSELEKQRQAEIDKKKTDNSVVEDYNQQIEEMKIAIRDFAIEAANDLYGIDLNGWAEQLGDALVDAFAAGEDAAEAFDKTVGDIMRDVTSKMISQDILAPMFGNLRDYLFGSDGMSGAFGSDFQLDPSEMGAMKEYLDKIKNEGIPAAQELFDAINDATGGMLNDTEKSKDGMTKGLQSLTENTGDLLASYLNAVRGDTAAMRLNWDKLMESMLPQINIIAEAQLTAQRQIAENTLRTAEAAEAIRSAMSDVTRNQDRLERSWRRIAEKNWGTY